MPVEVYYLEMRARAELKSKPLSSEYRIFRSENIKGSRSEFLYKEIGKRWDWNDKLRWSKEQWAEYGSRSELKTWEIYLGEELAGYFELEQQNGDVEMVYFGLTESFIGTGIGGATLSKAVEYAWEIPETNRVWLHTCSLDHPYARNNYLARGFRQYKTELE